MESSFEQVKQLRSAIKLAESTIGAIQKACPHRRILHVEKPDTYSGWGGSEECTDCGKFINAWTAHRFDQKPVRKIIKK